MPVVLISIPVLASAVALAIRSNRVRPVALPAAAAAHLACSSYLLFGPLTFGRAEWIALDPPGRVVLLVLSVLFLICSFYSVGYLRQRQDLNNRIFCVCLLLFLGM